MKTNEMDNALKNKKVDTKVVEKVTEYVKAALNPIVPEGKVKSNKSKYDAGDN